MKCFSQSNADSCTASRGINDEKEPLKTEALFFCKKVMKLLAALTKVSRLCPG